MAAAPVSTTAGALAALLPKPVAAREAAVLRADWVQTPLGAIVAVADAHALHVLEFADRKGLQAELRALHRAYDGGLGLGRFPAIEQVERELAAYFTGESPHFETPLRAWGTAFTRSVWAALRTIPAGETRSYGELAQRLGRPDAVRAVARANGANQLAILIPCHRVIGGNGQLRGYAGGLARKRWLLEHEAAHWLFGAPEAPA